MPWGCRNHILFETIPPEDEKGGSHAADASNMTENVFLLSQGASRGKKRKLLHLPAAVWSK